MKMALDCDCLYLGVNKSFKFVEYNIKILLIDKPQRKLSYRKDIGAIDR